jgi:thiol-disulfide isomerase/thioredoxin
LERKWQRLSIFYLKKANNYVVIFWNSKCYHCFRAIPELNGFLKGNKKVQIIALPWKIIVLILIDIREYYVVGMMFYAQINGQIKQL